jgi:glycerol dehydrogenase
MNRTFIAPRRYVQGPDVLKEIGSLLSVLGKKPAILWDATTKKIAGDMLLGSLKAAGIAAVDVTFGGQSTKEEAARVAQMVKSQGADIIVGVGGGKALDTAKAAAATAGTKMVSVPTIASNDSPTSSFTVWYNDEGTCLGFESWGVNPDLVLVDSKVISQSPVRSFVAGMGDALATWLEADACAQASAGNLASGTATMVAKAIARLCFDVIMKNGIEAMKAVEGKTLNVAVENVIEANVLMSGLGFESGGVATAHMVANGLPTYPECRKLMHGEEVGFGIITQLCLDKTFDDAERKRIVDFEIAIGLPVTFKDIGLEGVGRDRLKVLGDICGAKGSLCENHPFKVTSNDIVEAMIAADALGQARKKAK